MSHFDTFRHVILRVDLPSFFKIILQSESKAFQVLLERLCDHTPSCFLLQEDFFACHSSCPLALPFFVCSSVFLISAFVLNVLFLPKVRLLPSLLSPISPPCDLDLSIFPLVKESSGAFANCSLCGAQAAHFLFGRPKALKFLSWSHDYSASSSVISAVPTSLLFLFQTHALSLLHFPLLCLSFFLTFLYIWQEPSSLSFTMLQWFPDHSFLP